MRRQYRRPDPLLNDILIGQYIPGESVVHRLDPRTKILATLAIVSVLLSVRDWPGYAATVLFLILIIGLAGIPWGLTWRGLRPVTPLVLLTVALHAFSHHRDAEVIFRMGPLQATGDGLWFGISMGLRIALLVLVSTLLTFTTTPLQLTDGVEKLLRPFSRLGVPVHELAVMMTIALRFIPTLLDETDRIIKAQRARGAEISSRNPAAWAKVLVPILVPLFHSAFRRAEELATAMEARCYRGGENRTRYRDLQWRLLDAWAGIAALMMVVIIAWLGR